MHDAMSAINVEMRKVVLPITCKYEKDVDKDSDSTKCIWAFSMKKTRKLLKGLYRWKLGIFLVSVKFFWFEMARGEFSRFGVKKCPNMDVLRKIVKGPPTTRGRHPPLQGVSLELGGWGPSWWGRRPSWWGLLTKIYFLGHFSARC